MDFEALVCAIRETHDLCAAHANRAVNLGLTLRNWIIGGTIFVYEQRGEDRARYGDGMMARLARKLTDQGVPTCDPPRLYAYVAFYRTYPQILDAVPTGWAPFLAPPEIPRSLTAQSEDLESGRILRSVTGESSHRDVGRIFRSLTGNSITPGKTLVERLSYTHLEVLVGIGDPLERAFYEVECIRGAWECVP